MPRALWRSESGGDQIDEQCRVHRCRVHRYVGRDHRLRAASSAIHPTFARDARALDSRWPMNRKKATIIGGAVIILAAFAYLLYGGLDKNVVYFLTPQELLAK